MNTDKILELLRDAAKNISTADMRFAEMAEKLEETADAVYSAHRSLKIPAFPDTMEGAIAALEYREAVARVEAAEKAIRALVDKLQDRSGYNRSAGWTVDELRAADLCIEKTIDRLME